MQARSSFDHQQPATFGLATQLRTPPMDGNSFPAHTAVSPSSSPKKVTPAMREELRSIPKPSPAWSSREASSLPISKNMRERRVDGSKTMPSAIKKAERSGSKVVNEMGVWEEKGLGPQLPVKSSHLRSRSTSAVPARPARPASPSGPATHTRTNAPPLPPGASHHASSRHHPSASLSSRPADFNPNTHHLPRLDLGVKLDNAPYSTYNSTAAAKSSPDLRKDPRDDDEGLYEANVSVGVAQRVQRAASFRKASLGSLLAPNANQPTNLNGSSLVADRKGSADSGSSVSSHLRPPRTSVAGETPRPISQGLRQSYAGSVAPTAVFRRSSSVYVPNPVAAPPPTVTPAARLPLDLVTLARRTAHISSVPGYGWRLHLLEKLETIMGSFLTIQDAEAILSIGHGSEKKSNKRNESRKSQIGMPTSTSRARPAPVPKVKAPEKSSFFTKMKRALSAPGSHDHSHDKTPPPLPTSKAIFGVPLATVAEYGFVTSMIAGQRHDLPGVCFSTVEEIYRRGQGMNVPGLLHLAGEASRVATLVSIFDTAPDYGEHHDLSIESIHNVTSLLKKYLRDLPEPILDQRLWRLYLAACVDSTNSLKCRIASAQIILRLLPTPNFSLLVYLVAFLSQMPLFPENRLTLESVSTIFGPAAMSPRMSASTTSSKLPRLFNGASMHITGPTESFESTGANVKKAQDGLLWLLTNWSSVADGLLEPDFDIDVNEVLGRRPSVVAAPGDGLATTSEPVNFDKEAERDAVARSHDSARTLEILSVPRFESSEAPVPALGAPRRAPSPSPLPPPVITHEAPPSPSSTIKDSSSPILPRSFGFNRSPELHDGPHAPPSPLSPVAPEDAPPTPSKEEDEPVFKPELGTVKNRESALPSVPVEEEEEEEAEEDKIHSAQASDSTPETASSSRSSDSSLQSAWVATPTPPKEKANSPLLRRAAPELEKELEQSETVVALPRATPEDQFGPVGPPGTSVLEDLLEFDDSSIYSFPSPPGTRNFKQTVPFSTAAFDPPAPISPRPDETLLVRSSADQLKEAQALVETQRHEIQMLWKQLTDLELERTADRKEIAELHAQLRTSAGRLHLVEQQGTGSNDWEADRRQMEEERERLEEEHSVTCSAWEAKFMAAQREAQSAREELKAVHDERYQIQEMRDREDRETKQRIASLETQLNAIRNLLGGGKF